jgi:serine protease SohB
MDFIAEYGMFLAKSATVVLAVLAVVGGVAAIGARARPRERERIEVKNLSQVYEGMARTLRGAMLPKRALRQFVKADKARHKQEEKRLAKAPEATKRVYVLNFHGDIRASAVTALREEITAVLTVATPQDEVVLRLESAGGVVHGYGLAASQLERIRARGIGLTVAVDKVAASGGYMMACVAERIIAAPFAIVGSIGVVAQLPNFNRLLRNKDIDFEQFTAGEYKRTVTVFGENTERGRAKFQEEIEDVHALFKDFVKEHRAGLDLAKVATGEHWYGARAVELGLVDELRTSDDYLLEASRSARVYEVRYRGRPRPLQRLFSLAGWS